MHANSPGPSAVESSIQSAQRLAPPVIPAILALICVAVGYDLAFDSVAAQVFALACGLVGLAVWRRNRRIQRDRVAALIHSERRFRDFTEAGAHYVWEVGPDLRFTYVSDSIERVTGDKPEEIIGRTRPEIRPDDPYTTESAAALKRQVEAGVPFSDVPITRTTRDGRVIHLMTSGKPYFDQDGRYLGYRCSSRDFTAQVEAERAQKASEQRFRDFAEIGAHFLWERDADDRIVWVSEGLERLLGPGRGDNVGRLRGERLAPDPERDAERAAIAEKVRRRETFLDMPYRGVDRHGRTLYFAVSGKPFYDDAGKFCGYRGTTRDVTEQVQAREALAKSNEALQQTTAALAQSEHRFRDFANAASDWFWEQDRDFRFTFILLSDQLVADQRTGSSLGMTRREANPDGATPEEWERHEADLRAHRPFRDFRFRRNGANGKPRYLSVNGVPMFDEQGEFTGYRGTGRDITAEIVAAQEAQEARRAREIAEAASRAKSQFLAHISHELRTPLNAIIGFSEVMGREMLGPIGTAKYRDYAGDIRSSAHHLLALINDMLDMARIEVGKYRIEPETVAVSQLVGQALVMTRGLAEAGGLTLAAEYGEADLALFVDERAVRQVLLNLISNGIKFTASGGRIDVAVARNGAGGVTITVRDTGVGIPQSALPSLFEPFQRLSASKARAGGGTGLGLWISRNLMQLHQGDLSISSVEGEGTVATLTFPPSRLRACPDEKAPRAVA